MPTKASGQKGTTNKRELQPYRMGIFSALNLKKELEGITLFHLFLTTP